MCIRLAVSSASMESERAQASTFEPVRPASKPAFSRSRESVGKHLQQDLNLSPRAVKRLRGSIAEVLHRDLALQHAAEDEELSAVREDSARVENVLLEKKKPRESWHQRKRARKGLDSSWRWDFVATPACYGKRVPG